MEADNYSSFSSVLHHSDEKEEKVIKSHTTIEEFSYWIVKTEINRKSPLLWNFFFLCEPADMFLYHRCSSFCLSKVVIVVTENAKDQDKNLEGLRSLSRVSELPLFL